MASCSLLQPAINISLEESSTYILALPTPHSAVRTGSSVEERNWEMEKMELEMRVTGRLWGAHAENIEGKENVKVKMKRKKGMIDGAE